MRTSSGRPFKWGKMVVKGLRGAGVAGIAAAGAAGADGRAELKDLQAAFWAGVAGFIFEAARNWLKNR